MPSRAPRIAVLGLHLEANAFVPPTLREDFTQQCWEEGERISALARQVSHLPSELPGFYARMDTTGPWTPVPVVVIGAPPGGPMAQDVFLDFLDRVRRGLAAALPLDGVYVASHGASSATGDADSDGTLLELVRRIVGPVVPVVLTHDLHCNVSERLIAATDALIAYRTNPHVDARERAAEAADLMRRLLAGGRTAKAFVRLPIAPPSVTLLTAEGPYADLIRLGESLTGGDVLNVSVTGGFIFGDLPKCGMTVNVTTTGDQALADAVAARIALAAWVDRGRYFRPLTPLAEAVEIARQAGTGATGPVILADVADNPGGGGRGNTTWLLAALHAAAIPDVVLGVFVDPALAAEAHALGEGQRLRAVFNRVEDGFSKRFEAMAVVERLTDGTDIGRRGTSAGKRFSLGPSALLHLEGSGVRVVVGSLRRQLAEPRMLEMHGIDIAATPVVVVKSRGHFRAGFDEFVPAERTYEVDAPGLTSPVLANFAWQRLPRPIGPLDAGTDWTPPGGAEA
jgi:microcystin degradation protein MlrC